MPTVVNWNFIQEVPSGISPLPTPVQTPAQAYAYAGKGLMGNTPFVGGRTLRKKRRLTKKFKRSKRR
jgi:hypothetical protein